VERMSHRLAFSALFILAFFTSLAMVMIRFG
jgi:hypothetical protein